MSKAFAFPGDGAPSFWKVLRILSIWVLTKNRGHNKSLLRPAAKLEGELKCPKESFRLYLTNNERSIF